MKSIGAYEAKTHLPRLLDEVAQGQRITITKHGHPVAMLVPADSAPQRNVEDVIARFRELRKGVNLGGVSIKDLINEGRR